MKRVAIGLLVCVVVILGLRTVGLARKPPPPPKPLFHFSASNSHGGEVSIRVGSDGKVELDVDDGKGSDVHMTARKSGTIGASASSDDDSDDSDDDDDSGE